MDKEEMVHLVPRKKLREPSISSDDKLRKGTSLLVTIEPSAFLKETRMYKVLSDVSIVFKFWSITKEKGMYRYYIHLQLVLSQCQFEVGMHVR